MANVLAYLGRQTTEVRDGGIAAAWRKGRSFGRKALGLALLPVSLVVILLVRAIRPMVLVRIGRLTASRIGHYASDTELYLCRRDAGEFGRRTFDVFYHGKYICNGQLKMMWDRTLRLVPFGAVIDRMNRQLPGGDEHIVPMPTWTHYGQDMFKLVGRTQPHLSFTPEEERLGDSQLRGMGIPENAPFVCFHARDPAYLNETRPSNDWRYHDYRNSGISNYVPAAEELARRDYFAIRMGSVVADAIHTDNPRIIDYAATHRTEFLDVFLSGKCRFYLGSHDGLFELAASFRRPIAMVNLVPMEHAPTWGTNDLFIPKKLWLWERRRFMTFREIFDSEVAAFRATQPYEEAGIEVIENSPEEITDLAAEMDERLKGTWQGIEEDEELQARFWALFKVRRNHGPIVSRIGSEFLRQHRELLD